MPEHGKVYIGDGVYAQWNGLGVWLTTQREEGYADAIFLDPDMMRVLHAYVHQFYAPHV